MRDPRTAAALDQPSGARPGNSVRAGVLARIAAWLDHAQSAQPTIGLISGAEGMGKTVLARDAASIARHLGFVTAIVEGHAADVPSLVGSQLAEEMGLGAGVTEAQVLRSVRFELQRLASRGRCVALVFEDVHRYQPVDLALVQDLAFSPPCARLAIIVTLRTHPLEDPPDHVSTFLRQLDGAEEVEHIALAPLSFAEGSELVRSCAPGAPAAPRFVRDALEFTRGNPMQLAMLVQHLEGLPVQERMHFFSGSRMLDALHPGPAIVRAIRPRLSQLSPRARTLLEALAVWSLPATAEVLSALAGEPLDEVESEMEWLERAGVLRAVERVAAPRFAFAEPMLASVLFDEMPTLQRRRIHGRAAELLATCGESSGDAAALARANHHLSRPGTIEPVMAGQVVAAARYLIRRSRYESARDLLTRLVERMEEEGSIESAPAAVFVLLAETLSRSGAWQDANRMLATVVSSGREAGVELSALLRTARDHIALGRDGQALEIYTGILRSQTLDERTRAQVLIDAARVEHLHGRPDQAMHGFRTAAALADETDNAAHAAESRMAQALALVVRGQPAAAFPLAREAFALAQRCGDRALLARATAGMGNVLADMHSLQRGVRWMRRGLHEAERADDYPTAAWTASRLAAACIELGEWRAAEDAANASFHIDAGLHRIRSLRRSRAVQSLLHALQGQSDPLDVGLSDTYRGAEDFGGPTVFVPDLAARYEHQLLRGRYDEAERSVTTAYDLLAATPGWERFLILDVLPRLAALYASAGSAEGVERVVNEFAALRKGPQEWLPVLEPQHAYACAQLAMVRGEWEEGAHLAREAAAAFARLGYRWRQAVALQDAGGAMARSGSTLQATAALEDAYRLFERMGAVRRLAEVRSLLHQLGRRARRSTPRRSALTARQWQVAELASRGLTDAEIAKSLSISRRTVTTHMHNILQSLPLRSRVELRRWIEANESDRAAALADMM